MITFSIQIQCGDDTFICIESALKLLNSICKWKLSISNKFFFLQVFVYDSKHQFLFFKEGEQVNTLYIFPSEMFHGVHLVCVINMCQILSQLKSSYQVFD